MKIIWNQNPLRTVVELDEHEKEVLWYKVKIQEMEELLYTAHFHLTPDYGYFNAAKVQQACDPSYFISDEYNKDKPSLINQTVDERHKTYLDALQGSHDGDCICHACSCIKCHAEQLLGVDTILGLRKHQAAAIHQACGGWKEQIPIEQAIKTLEEYDAHKRIPQWKGEQKWYDKWNLDHKQAAEWLKMYKNTHFSGNITS